MRRCYIAGPYTAGDVCENVSRAMLAWHALQDAGFAPFCPHLFHFLHMVRQKEYGVWTAQDIAWLDCCEFLVRLSGDSSGADTECALARDIGIPVYHTIEEAIESESP